MYENNTDLTLRNCYNSSGEIMNDADLYDFEPLKELLEMFCSLRSAKAASSLEQAG